MSVLDAISELCPGRDLSDLGGPQAIADGLSAIRLRVRRIGLGDLLRSGWKDTSPQPFAYGFLSEVPDAVLKCYLDSACVAAVSRVLLVLGEDDSEREIESLMSARGWRYCPQRSLDARAACGDGSAKLAVFHPATGSKPARRR